ncbi:hypothetical protein NXW13_00875 [Bacteroides thetaiotaomicron]|nr:hypothetical protein [Bacteroides thetaiotaomicron]
MNLFPMLGNLVGDVIKLMKRADEAKVSRLAAKAVLPMRCSFAPDETQRTFFA